MSRGEGEADLSGGVSLECCFPDTRRALSAACHDFRAFLKADTMTGEREDGNDNDP